MNFEEAASSNSFDVVAFMGHDGLMGFNLEVPNKTEGSDNDVIVLCCLSEKYFADRSRFGTQPGTDDPTNDVSWIVPIACGN